MGLLRKQWKIQQNAQKLGASHKRKFLSILHPLFPAQRTRLKTVILSIR